MEIEKEIQVGPLERSRLNLLWIALSTSKAIRLFQYTNEITNY